MKPDQILSERSPLIPAVVAVVGAAAIGLAASGMGWLGLAVVLPIPVLYLVFVYPFQAFIATIVLWPILAQLVRVDLPAGIPDATFDRIALLTIGLSTVVGVSRSRLAANINPWVAIYFIAQMISLLVWSSLDAAIGLLIPAAVYWLTKSLVSSSVRYALVLGAIVLAALTVSWTGIYERLLDLEYPIFNLKTGTALGTRYLDVPGGRAAGVLGNPAVYGAVAASGMLSVAALWFRAKKDFAKLLIAIAIVNLAYSVYVSYTRSAWLAAVVGLVVALTVSRDFRQPAKLIALTFAVAAAFAFLLNIEAPDTTAALDRLSVAGTVEGRVSRAALSLQHVGDSPLLGQGPGELDRLIGRRFPVGGFDTSHNTYLTMAVDGGLLITVPFIAMVSSWFRRAMLAHSLTRRGGFARNTLAVTLGILTIYLVSGIFLDLRYFGFYGALFFASGALVELAYSEASRRRLQFDAS